MFHFLNLLWWALGIAGVFLAYALLHSLLWLTPEARRFWISTFSEADGSGSFSRVCSFILAMAMLGLIIWCTVKRIPFPFSLNDAAIFIAAPYATNKVVALAQAARGAFPLGAAAAVDKPPGT